MTTRQLPADTVACEQGQWVVRGQAMTSPAWLLLLASGRLSWEDFRFWRDPDGALRASGEYRARGLIYLLPTGTTERLAMRIPLQPET